MRVVDPSWPLRANEQTVDTEGGPVWVAADESGSSGENLIDPGSVFAHASVRIDDLTAEPILGELREQGGAVQAPEVKFNQFKKDRGLSALAELFAADGPLAGRVTIVVADKRFLITSQMIDLLVEEEAFARGIDIYSDGTARKMAVTLFKEGPRALGELWEPLTAAFVSLARATRRGGGERETVESFFDRLEKARWRCRRRAVEARRRRPFDRRPGPPQGRTCRLEIR